MSLSQLCLLTSHLSITHMKRKESWTSERRTLHADAARVNSMRSEGVKGAQYKGIGCHIAYALPRTECSHLRPNIETSVIRREHTEQRLHAALLCSLCHKQVVCLGDFCLGLDLQLLFSDFLWQVSKKLQYLRLVVDFICAKFVTNHGKFDKTVRNLKCCCISILATSPQWTPSADCFDHWKPTLDLVADLTKSTREIHTRTAAGNLL